MANKTVFDSFNTQLIFDQWHDGLIIIDQKGCIVLFNRVAQTLLSYTEEDILGKQIHSFLCAPSAKFKHNLSDCPFSFSADVSSVFSSKHSPEDYEENVLHEAWWIAKSGHYLQIDYKRIPIVQEQESFILFSFQDCTYKKRSERELQRLALYAELNPTLIVEFDSNGLIHYSNPAMMEQIADSGFNEIDPDEINIQDSGLPVILPKNTNQLIKQCLSDGKTIHNIEHYINDNWFLWSFHPVLEGSSVQAYAIDITERKKIESTLFAEKEKFLVTLNSIIDGVITVDNDENICFINQDAIRLSGCDINQVEGQSFKDIIKILNVNAQEKSEDIVHRCLKEGRIIRHKEHRLILHQDGYVTTVKQIVAPMFDNTNFDNTNKVIGAVIVLHDVTETYQLEQKLSYQATHDQLTGLINRAEFEQRLNHTINIAYSDKVSHAMLYLDLDNFKIINDACGHIAGDQLLLQITQKLKTKFRRGDILARLGGDEFGALLDDCSILMAQKIAEDICLEVRHFNFIWDSQEYSTGVSIGVVAINEESDTVDHILSMADASCYAAKDLGRNRVHVYQSDDLNLIAKQGEMLWVSRINKALKNDSFILYFQLIKPIFDSEDLHFEILLRMLDEHGNIIPPDNFLPAAEHYDLISKIDLWVIQHTFDWFAKHPHVYNNISLCSINLSGTSLADQTIAQHIIWELEDKNLDAHKFCFEVTETAAIENLVLASQFIETLREKGCSFSLDDFGSGMSSFGYLKQLNVDFLKIDGQFVKDILIDKIDEAMVKSINEIGHTMGLKTIAEYVENEAIFEKLKLMKIDFAQGYAIAKPEPLKVLSQKV